MQRISNSPAVETLSRSSMTLGLNATLHAGGCIVGALPKSLETKHWTGHNRDPTHLVEGKHAQHYQHHGGVDVEACTKHRDRGHVVHQVLEGRQLQRWPCHGSRAVVAQDPHEVVAERELKPDEVLRVKEQRAWKRVVPPLTSEKPSKA